MSEICELISDPATIPGNQDAVGSGPADRVGPATAEPAGIPLERLEAQICELAGHLTAATCRFLLLIGDFDARRGWASWDLPSCAAWLAWKCQIAPGTAREHARVARALRTLPVICAEFAAGRLSYAKARALTRIATPATDADLAEIAGPMTAGQLERFARAHRQVTAADDQRARAARRVSWRWEEDGSLAMSLKLPAADGAVVMQALRAAADDLEHPHQLEYESATARTPVGGEEADVPAGTPPGEEDVPAETPAGGQAEPAAGLADALVEIAGAFLAGKITAGGNADLYQVIVHVGPEALTTDPETEPKPHAEPETEPPAKPQPADVPAGTCAGDVPGATRPAGSDRMVGHPADPRRCHLEDGPALNPATAQRLACVATISWMLHDHHGNLLDVGRRHRTPPPALRRAVRERDRYRCQFPGCNSRRTDLHHIRHWAKGGKTRLSNMTLLCEAHHVIVHELGYLITPAPGGGFAFTRPDGIPVPASPPLPTSGGDLTTCHQAAITEDTIIPSWNGDKLDLDHAIWVAFANARLAEYQD